MILLVITLVTNFVAQVIVRRFELPADGQLMDEPISTARRRGRSRRRKGSTAPWRRWRRSPHSLAVAVLVIAGRLGAQAGAASAQPRLLHEGPGDVRRDGRRHRARARRHAACSSGSRPRWRCRSACWSRSTSASSRGRACATRSALSLDVLNGFPSIVIGIFVFALLVSRATTQSGLAGAFALAIIMLPLVARATMEVLALVPNRAAARRASRSARRAGGPSSGSCSRPRSEAS